MRKSQRLQALPPHTLHSCDMKDQKGSVSLPLHPHSSAPAASGSSPEELPCSLSHPAPGGPVLSVSGQIDKSIPLDSPSGNAQAIPLAGCALSPPVNDMRTSSIFSVRRSIERLGASDTQFVSFAAIFRKNRLTPLGFLLSVETLHNHFGVIFKLVGVTAK